MRDMAPLTFQNASDGLRCTDQTDIQQGWWQAARCEFTAQLATLLQNDVCHEPVKLLP